MSSPTIDQALVDIRTPRFQNGYNDTQGWLPTKLVKHSRSTRGFSTFAIGQLVACRYQPEVTGVILQ
jgi:hypothetical protein